MPAICSAWLLDFCQSTSASNCRALSFSRPAPALVAALAHTVFAGSWPAHLPARIQLFGMNLSLRLIADPSMIRIRYVTPLSAWPWLYPLPAHAENSAARAHKRWSHKASTMPSRSTAASLPWRAPVRGMLSQNAFRGSAPSFQWRPDRSCGGTLFGLRCELRHTR